MWTKAELEQAIELRRKGCTYRQIAEKMGITQAALYGRMNRLACRRNVERVRDFDESELERMHDMRVRGQSIHEIAEYFGCGSDIISMQLRRFGVISRDYLMPEVRAEIKRLHGEGYPYSEIGRRVDLTSVEVQYAMQWMRQHGEI